MVYAGVLVADARGIEGPRRFVERFASTDAGFSHLIVRKPVNVGW
jgi:hypothetical protein